MKLFTLWLLLFTFAALPPAHATKPGKGGSDLGSTRAKLAEKAFVGKVQGRTTIKLLEVSRHFDLKPIELQLLSNAIVKRSPRELAAFNELALQYAGGAKAGKIDVVRALVQFQALEPEQSPPVSFQDLVVMLQRHSEDFFARLRDNFDRATIVMQVSRARGEMLTLGQALERVVGKHQYQRFRDSCKQGV